MFLKIQKDILRDQDFQNLTNFIGMTKRLTQFINVANFERAYA